MALNPHVARRAQKELDEVLGSERLPDFSDEVDLPYISAIAKELYRWGCPFPIGVPKRVREDDTYNNYFIPAGTIVVENIWCVGPLNVQGSTIDVSFIKRNTGQCFATSPSTSHLERSIRNGSSKMENLIL